MTFQEFWKTQEESLKTLGATQAEINRTYYIASNAWTECQEEMIKTLPFVDCPEPV